jgi:hypothetical protein
VAGLALIGTAAAAQLIADGGKERRFDAEQDAGCFWRFLAVCHAGGLSLDEGLMSRVVRGMTVSRLSQNSELDLRSFPWKLSYLDKLHGFRNTLPDLVDELVRDDRRTSMIMVGLAYGVAGVVEELVMQLHRSGMRTSWSVGRGQLREGED